MKRKDIAVLLDEPARAHPKRAGSGCAEKPKPDGPVPHLIGLAATDALVAELARISGVPVAARVERQRSL